MFQRFKNYYHLGVAIIANVLTGFPARGLTVIGVTGTDGKTTTASLIYHILNEAKMNPSLISSVGAFIGGKKYDVGFHVTTPTPANLPRFIRKAKQEKSKYLVLEITSHGLDQNRAWGVNFKIGVITNITREHLDYHKTYENYVRTKFKLLKAANVAIYNNDDSSTKLLEDLIKKTNKKTKWITYGIKNKAIITPVAFKYKSSIPGDFNNYNILAAIGVCRELGISDEDIRKGIESFNLPIGRVETVYKGQFEVVIDFAHTPNSIEQVLKSSRAITKGRIIHIFGSAGKRDFAKRPVMGEMSAKYADIIILTAEDPRGESIEKISNEIAIGIGNDFERRDINNFKTEKGKLVLKINDRKKAIEFAVSIAKKGDLVIMTGKSHEKSMNYGKGEEPWDEFAITREALKKLKI